MNVTSPEPAVRLSISISFVVPFNVVPKVISPPAESIAMASVSVVAPLKVILSPDVVTLPPSDTVPVFCKSAPPISILPAEETMKAPVFVTVRPAPSTEPVTVKFVPPKTVAAVVESVPANVLVPVPADWLKSKAVKSTAERSCTLLIETEPSEVPPPTAPAKEIFLNFDNASLSNLITYMADLKEINIIPNSATDNHKISLTIREALDIPEAWSVFLTVLEMAGYSIVEVGQVHKIISKDSKYTEPLPVYIGTPAENLPDSDQTVRFVAFLTNLQSSDQQVGQLLQSMLNQGALVIPQEAVNGFIITDRCYNIKSAMKVINALYTSGYHETVRVLNLKNANA